MITVASAAVKRQVGADPLERGERHAADFYRTGAVGTRALLAVERFPGVIWEPACGDGAMVAELTGAWGRAAGIEAVRASDLHDRGCGQPGWNFLDRARQPSEVAHVITNPPFRLPNRRDAIVEFARRGLEIVPIGGKVALLARLAWLEGTSRSAFFGATPPTRVWVFPWRCPMARGDLGGEMAGLVAFAWYVWQRGCAGTRLGWLPPKDDLKGEPE